MGISPKNKQQFVEEMVKAGASIAACNMWSSLMTTAAINEDDLNYVYVLCDLAKHLECHPVNVIHTALSLGKFTKVNDDMMKAIHQMVSDDTDSQCDKDEFWKDAGEPIDHADSSESHSYEEEDCACEHAIIGYCVECHGAEDDDDVDDKIPFWKEAEAKEANSGKRKRLVESTA